MEFQPTGNYRCASKKVLMDVFGNEFGHIHAFIGTGRLSIAIRLQANEHRIWIWFLLGIEVFVFTLLSTVASFQSLSHASLSLGNKWLCNQQMTYFQFSAESYRYLHSPIPRCYTSTRHLHV